jgi:hypothetical protein
MQYLLPVGAGPSSKIDAHRIFRKGFDSFHSKRVVRFVHNAAFTVLFKKGQPQLLEILP